jgi:hypothetical protein
MASKPAVLFQSQAIPAAETTVYPSPTSIMTTITKLSSENTSGSAVTVTVKLVQSGAGAGVTHVQAKKTLLPDEAYGWPEIVGHHLNPGDFISVLPTGTGVNMRGSGTQTAV